MPRIRLFVAALAVIAAACTSGGDPNQADGPTESAADERALFDSTVVHDIAVSFDDADYDAMIKAFADTDAKEWVEATVTIDGTTYEHVGMRLKGNSSLAGLGGGFGGRGGPQGGGGGGGGGGIGSASAENPQDLPWLIRLDEFVEGQDHQGYEDIVIRSNGSATSLNEAVALDLLDEAGLASQAAAPTSFRVNGDAAVLRLAIEHPDDDAWQKANFATDGALYKAESSGDWSYRGNDPAAYEEVWDQEGGSDVTDLTPLTDFLKFLNESEDATFATELPQRLDVEAFASYLAMMDLVANFDDIDGPGNNAYLWYDVATKQFTVVAWDMNLAFGTGFGGGRGGPGVGGPPGGFNPGNLPEGFAPGQVPGGGGPGGGRFGRSNVLVPRFHANAEFEAMYQEQLTTLRAQLYGTATADDVLTSWVDTLTKNATGLVDTATIDTEAAAIAEQFTT